MLVVEDSNVVRQLLIHALESDPEISVVGSCSDGEEAVRTVMWLKPDVITMDVHMPRLDGLEATRQIMETQPVPIVIVSGSAPRSEMASTFEAMEAGALAVLPRPRGLGHPQHAASVAELRETVKLMAEVKVVRRWARGRKSGAPNLTTIPRRDDPRLVALGASTGGPPVLRTILAGLPRHFPLPIVIVQHMSSGFLGGFGEWLSAASDFPVKIAGPGEQIAAGIAYLAPDDYHLSVTRSGQVRLLGTEPEHGLRPSVSVLFRSLLESYGSAVAAGLLTGMGRDGADELKRLREAGAITFAQDKESSVVHGMPGEAIRIGAAELELSPEMMVTALRKFAPASDKKG